MLNYQRVASVGVPLRQHILLGMDTVRKEPIRAPGLRRWTFPNMKSEHYDPQMAERHTHTYIYITSENKLNSNKEKAAPSWACDVIHFGFLGR